jgi:MurNAc alpha-1-phosphate uridylyltransferase
MTIKTAMLMAAGMGTRMRPLTLDKPKPLIEVAGKALIDYTLDNLIDAGVERAIVNVHYLADLLEVHLKSRKDIEIVISDERDELLETGGGVVKALPHLGEKPVFICNTDAFWLPDNGQTLRGMIETFNSDAMESLLLLAKREHTMGYHGAGDFSLLEDNVLKRRGDAPDAPYVFAGAYILNPQTVHGLSVKPFSANEYWNVSLEAGRLRGTVMTPFWMHVGDPNARDAAEKHIHEGRV